MNQDDKQQFFDLICGVHAFYRRDTSEFSMSVWWNAMQAFDLSAVRDALGRHAMNPDTGQFMPMPADVVKMLAGRTVDAAQVAWSKVDRAVRHVGTYASVAFDDALIHRVLQDMGGWTPLGRKSEEEWPFVAKEFETRYRGYAIRSERPPYPPYLIGIYEAENSRRGMDTAPPRLIGDAKQATTVMLGGGDSPAIRVTEASPEIVAQLAVKDRVRALIGAEA